LAAVAVEDPRGAAVRRVEVLVPGADDQVVEAVSVHVPSPRDARAELRPDLVALEREVRDRSEERDGVREEQERAPLVQLPVRELRGADDQVPATVAAHVARACARMPESRSFHEPAQNAGSSLDAGVATELVVLTSPN